MPQDIITMVKDNIGYVTIDRKDGRNTLRTETLKEIIEAFDNLISDSSVRVIVFSGEGKHFSAGADFAFLEGLTKMTAVDIGDQIYAAFQGAARRIWTCPKPTIAAINGAAITVGCELALACDFRLIGPDAMFQESWIRLGIIPPLGGLFLLPRLVGLAKANEMVLTGQAVHADEALRIGLATWSVADTAELPGAAHDYAIELAALPPLAYRAAKDGIRRGLESSMDKEWQTNLLNQVMLLGSKDFREGLSAVIERRKPAFIGA